MQDGGLETQSTECCVTQTSQPEKSVAVDSVLKLSRRARLRLRIGSLWERLREQRREAAAVVVLIVVAIIWSDTGSSGSGSAANSPDSFDSFEAVLSDSGSVGDGKTQRESADPFESSQDSFDSGLYFPPSEESASENSASANSAFEIQTSADYGPDQQHLRKVKFAGRIQPAN